MKKSIFLKLIVFMLVGAMPVAVLYYKSRQGASDKNGFFRLLPSHPFERSNSLDITYNSYYISGITASRIYLGNRTAPLHIFSTDLNLKNPKTHQLKLATNEKIFYDALRVRIDSPFVFASEDITPALYQGMIASMTLHPIKLNIKLPLITLLPVLKSNLIIRSYDSTLHRNVLSKLSIEPFALKAAPEILKKQIDGFFCTDGMLCFDQKTSRLVYVYYYRNQYVHFDLNMKVLGEGNTIDTIRLAKIKVDKIISDNKTTMSAPPITVNKNSCIDSNRLYVYSPRISNNETKSVFDLHSAIDVYTLADGRYQFSFYIPDVNGKKISSFKVSGTNLVAIQDHFLVSYSLNL